MTISEPDAGDTEPTYEVPHLAVHCGLEVNDDGCWSRITIPGLLQKWWKPADGHPQAVATELWSGSNLSDGEYRAVWAPKDRRRTLDPGEPFELPSEHLGSGGHSPPADEDAEPETTPTREPTTRWGPGNPPPARRQAAQPRQPQRTPRPQPQTYTRPEPASSHPLLHRHDQSLPDGEVSTLLYVHAIYEGERERAHQRSMQLNEYMIATVNARADQAIASERERSNQMIAFIQTTTEARRRAELAPLEQSLATLSEDFSRVQDDAEIDANARLVAQMEQMTQSPDGPQALINALGSFLSSPGGEMLAGGLRKFLGGGDAPTPPAATPEGPFDPGGA